MDSVTRAPWNHLDGHASQALNSTWLGFAVGGWDLVNRSKACEFDQSTLVLSCFLEVWTAGGEQTQAALSLCRSLSAFQEVLTCSFFSLRVGLISADKPSGLRPEWPTVSAGERSSLRSRSAVAPRSAPRSARREPTDDFALSGTSQAVQIQTMPSGARRSMVCQWSSNVWDQDRFQEFQAFGTSFLHSLFLR